MTKISGFTFIHNALDSGYPLVEAVRTIQPYVNEVVVVDMQSTDGTRDLLKKMVNTPFYDVKRNYEVPLRIIDGEWGNQAGETLRQAHSKYIECDGDVIVHFEADEVFSDSLIRSVVSHIKSGVKNILVYRLQLEQNFQRCRWYPEPVHRIFPRMGAARKKGHTTDQHEKGFLLTEKNGYLWDITNCFRDNWMGRVNKQAELRDCEPQYVMTPLHTLHKAELTEAEVQKWLLSGKHWTWTHTPFDIPDILKSLVGMTKYEPKV